MIVLINHKDHRKDNDKSTIWFENRTKYDKFSPLPKNDYKRSFQKKNSNKKGNLS